MAQLLTIELFGQPYTFKADEDFNKAKEVADYFVKEVERVETQQAVPPPGMSKMAALILTALNIANENYELKRKQASLYQTLNARLEDLLKLLDDRLSIPD